jgi:hypothetical protein
MQSDQQGAQQFQPRVFNYSLDWRFLLPLSSPDKVFVLFEENSDFCQTLEQVGIPVSNQLSFLDIQQKEKNQVNSLVLPFGVPVHWVSGEEADQVEFFRSMRKLISEHGNLLVGFNNSRGYRSKAQKQYHSATLQRMISQLQKAGFKAVKVFGVIPNLNIPEYIFDLNARPLHFALQHRFERKPVVLNLLQLLSYTVGLVRISDFLPGYFIAAIV